MSVGRGSSTDDVRQFSQHTKLKFRIEENRICNKLVSNSSWQLFCAAEFVGHPARSSLIGPLSPC